MASASAADLWQLEIIISDGICQDHEKLRTVLRKAEEQRIMVVFILLDAAASSSSSPGGGGSRGASESVLDLKEVKFKRDALGGTQVVIERYLDSFPFQYYLIVHDLEDLPTALAGLLRTWFAEVNA